MDSNTNNENLNETIQDSDTIPEAVEIEFTKPIEETSETKEDSHMVELYEFYKSNRNTKTATSCVNKVTVTMFTVFMCLCLVIFISCMVIDFSNPNVESLTLGDSSVSELLGLDDDYTSNYTPSSGIVINQYNPPERTDDTYINEDGSYTVAGVAKYASDSILAIYTSTDGKTLDGMGSGIIFSEDGYIITNAHVIENANVIMGELNDGTQFQLSLVGMNTDLDIAVLQSSEKDLPVATMGNSDKVILGEQVVAIGNPAGLTGTVTEGIVSSIDRSYTTSDNTDRTFIQTDTAISPGNSGGALLNMYGQVIGITSLKISEDQTYEGLGFAICINDALECAETLIQNRFKIGIEFNSANQEVLITNIVEGTSIATTQLAEGDVITEINGTSVYDYGSIMSVLEGSKPGDTVTAKVQRRTNGLVNEFYIEFQLMAYGS
jgi:serine protease Do